MTAMCGELVKPRWQAEKLAGSWQNTAQPFLVTLRHVRKGTGIVLQV